MRSISPSRAALLGSAVSLSLLCAVSALASGSRFPDVPASHWAHDYIVPLADDDVLKGRDDGHFRPQWQVTRAELAKIALRAAKVKTEDGLANPYPDLTGKNSLKDELLTAFANGYLAPIDGKAEPDRPATRFETLKTLMDAFGIAPSYGIPVFPDTTGAATGYANAAYELGIISGNGGLFKPEDSVTRAEVAKMAQKLRKAKKKPPVSPPLPSSTIVPSSAPLPSSSPPPSITPTGSVQRGGSAAASLPPLFPSDNWWNADISAAPVDAGSGGYVNFIGPTRGLHPDLGGNANAAGTEVYGMPYIVVPGSQPLVPVTYVLYGDESDTGAPGRPGFPIPDVAKTAAGWIEGGTPGGGTDGDHHMLLVDRDNLFLYELYQAHWTGSRWEAGSGAVYDLRANGRRPDGWTSADAAGLAILPGLIRYDEAFGSTEINHAFRMTVRATNGYVHPASHRAGGTAGALPMGARIRLKAGKDLSSYPPEVQRIFRAMKKHGLIVADNGSDMYITGTYDTRWDNGVLNPAFSSLKASDFEVVQLGWQP